MYLIVLVSRFAKYPLRRFLVLDSCNSFPPMICRIVEYETIEDAQNAINTLSDTELGSRNIFVREVLAVYGVFWQAGVTQ